MTLEKMNKIKQAEVDLRSDLLEVMEEYDTYLWHNETKYLNADLTAIMALLQALIGETNEVIANHMEILER